MWSIGWVIFLKPKPQTSGRERSKDRRGLRSEISDNTSLISTSCLNCPQPVWPRSFCPAICCKTLPRDPTRVCHLLAATLELQVQRILSPSAFESSQIFYSLAACTEGCAPAQAERRIDVLKQTFDALGISIPCDGTLCRSVNCISQSHTALYLAHINPEITSRAKTPVTHPWGIYG